MKNVKMKKKSAFTLIELLIVVAIIGVLAAVGIPSYKGYIEDAKKNANLAQVTSVINLLNAEIIKVSMGSTSDYVNKTTGIKFNTPTSSSSIFGKMLNPYDTSKYSVVAKTDVSTCDSSKLGTIYINYYTVPSRVSVAYCDVNNIVVRTEINIE